MRGLGIESHQRVAGAQSILVSEMAEAFALFRSCDYRRGDEDTGRPGQVASVSLRGESYENPHGETGAIFLGWKGPSALVLKGLLSSWGGT